MKVYHIKNSVSLAGAKLVIKTKIAYLLLGFMFIAIIMQSCKKFVEVEPPKNRLISKSIFTTNETANAAILNIYSLMSNSTGSISPYFMALYNGLSADELKSYSTTLTLQQIYLNQINSKTSASTNNLWNVGFNYIFRANAIIEGVKLSTSINVDVRQQIICEALFIRAFWHFYLVNAYGNIPIVTTTDYVLNAQLAREDKAIVYVQIVDDLTKAISGLNDNYVGLNGTSVSSERVRPNKLTARALLSRVYLYLEKYLEAEEQASKVIDTKATYAIVSLDSTFLKNNKESIWQLMVTTPNTSNTSEGLNFILMAKPSSGLSNSSTITTSLLNAFDLNDKRKSNWIGKYTDLSVTPNLTYYYPNKYKVKTGAAISEYSTVLRLGEQYLIRAEALAKQGNLIKAIEDLDVIRKRAGIDLIKNINPNITKEDLIDAILKERRVELFTEWGHRWYDLKRTGKINAMMNSAAIEKGSIWTSSSQLWPIPLPDILNNARLIQNPGYD